MYGDIGKSACEAVFFSTQERFSTLTVLNDLNCHKERTALLPLPPLQKGWSLAPALEKLLRVPWEMP